MYVYTHNGEYVYTYSIYIQTYTKMCIKVLTYFTFMPVFLAIYRFILEICMNYCVNVQLRMMRNKQVHAFSLDLLK